MKASSLLRKRVTVLEETVYLLNALMSEIRFSKISIIAILSSLSEETSVKNLDFLKRFSDFDLYGDFHKEWHKAITVFPYYKNEEKAKMLQLGSFLGTTDTDSQIKTINLYFTYFEGYRENAKSEYDKYGKVSSLFGLFVGASVFILLL